MNKAILIVAQILMILGYKNSGLILGHQRLSILDLSINANQPMHSNSGRFVWYIMVKFIIIYKSENEISKADIKWRCLTLKLYWRQLNFGE